MGSCLMIQNSVALVSFRHTIIVRINILSLFLFYLFSFKVLAFFIFNQFLGYFKTSS